MLNKRKKTCLNCKNAMLIEGGSYYKCNQEHIKSIEDKISNIIMKTGNPNIYLNMIRLKVIDEKDAIGFPKSFKIESIIIRDDYKYIFKIFNGCIYFNKK